VRCSAAKFPADFVPALARQAVVGELVDTVDTVLNGKDRFSEMSIKRLNKREFIEYSPSAADGPRAWPGWLDSRRTRVAAHRHDGIVSDVVGVGQARFRGAAPSLLP
jgi:hypothetical protein